MKLHFIDYATEPQSERDFVDAESLGDFMDQQRKDSMMCQLISDNGYQLQIGIDGEIGCAQFLSVDSLPPYYLAVTPIQVIEGTHHFDLGGSTTEMLSDNCLPFDLLKKVVLEFLQTGQKSELVKWEEV